MQGQLLLCHSPLDSSIALSCHVKLKVMGRGKAIYCNMKSTCGIYTHYFKDLKWMSAIDGGRIGRQYVLEEEWYPEGSPQFNVGYRPNSIRPFDAQDCNFIEKYLFPNSSSSFLVFEWTTCSTPNSHDWLNQKGTHTDCSKNHCTILRTLQYLLCSASQPTFVAALDQDRRSI